MTDTLPTVLAARCPRCERLVQIDRITQPGTTWFRGICGHVWSKKDGLALRAAS